MERVGFSAIDGSRGDAKRKVTSVVNHLGSSLIAPSQWPELPNAECAALMRKQALISHVGRSAQIFIFKLGL